MTNGLIAAREKRQTRKRKKKEEELQTLRKTGGKAIRTDTGVKFTKPLKKPEPATISEEFIATPTKPVKPSVAGVGAPAPIGTVKKAAEGLVVEGLPGQKFTSQVEADSARRNLLGKTPEGRAALFAEELAKQEKETGQPFGASRFRGLNPEQIAKRLEEEKREEFVEGQEETKTRLERQFEEQRRVFQEQQAQVKKAGEAQKGAITAAIAPGREGFLANLGVSPALRGIVEEKTQSALQSIDFQFSQVQDAQNRLTQLQEEQKEAFAAGQVEKSDRLAKEVLLLRQSAATAETELKEQTLELDKEVRQRSADLSAELGKAIVDKTDEELQELASERGADFTSLKLAKERALFAETSEAQVRARETIDSLIESSAIATIAPEALAQMAIDADIGKNEIFGIAAEVKRIKEDSKIDDATKALEFTKLKKEVEQIGKAKISKEKQALTDMFDLLEGETDPAKIDLIKRSFGFDEKKRAADLREANAAASLKEADAAKKRFETADAAGLPTPTGQQETVTFSNRDLTLDTIATSGLSAIDEAAKAAGLTQGLKIGAVASSTFRTAAQQKALFDAGKTPLDGTTARSKHQDGLAIDLFPDPDYIASMKPIMEANGWIQTVGTGDEGHFEFQGTRDTQLQAQIRGFVQSRSGVKDKDARLQLEKDIATEISAGRANTPAEAKRNLGIVSVEDKEVKDRIRIFLKKPTDGFNEIERSVNNIVNLSTITGGIGDVATITSFLKAIDPGSVARESEVAGVETARGLIEGFKTQMIKLETGQKLGEDQRDQLRESANVILGAARRGLFEKLITSRDELENERGVEATIISNSQINKLEREIGKEVADQIREENNIAVEKAPETRAERLQRLKTSPKNEKNKSTIKDIRARVGSGSTTN